MTSITAQEMARLSNLKQRQRVGEEAYCARLRAIAHFGGRASRGKRKRKRKPLESA